MSDNNSEQHKITKDPITGAETTGHVWDDDLQEFNNPLPRWWLWAFYGTIIFTIVYWVIYPSWPTGLAKDGYIPGTSTLTFKSDKIEDGKRTIAAGPEVTTHWNTRALLAVQMQTDPNELKRQEMVKKVAATPLDTVAKDPQQSAFVLAYGKGIFGDYCAACHQAGGQGVIGHYPNIIDDAWLWGSDSADIETTIRKGRKGNMPAQNTLLNPEEITEAANYVLSLSGEPVDAGLAAKGKVIFETKGCSGCHMPTGVGMKALGSANLTDKIWTQADVPGAKDMAAKVTAVEHVIANGIQREMPAWESRLSNDEIKVLVAYIKLLSSE
ncbi:c-type cytochrome [Cocleimonas sp. KMM 6892]|uniref:c-type cytochrome n=1 Tax=unclassified Cocleimonas TaxID=2639732 RepID=UPI002DB7B4FB|nr:MULTISPECIES: c-type cytochrome [unclassified Cocleimonas]MEB8432135.1 c-type cytochrome [Cocleimonas sp. KMM 6892]MEC4714779.1 c-type cytochrome [Cocleimonas sp. KMM 6895]MEC4744407.1 c-type cytochrome [Cocleimonas sp. KMM 6896]